MKTLDDAIMCRGAAQLAPTITNEVMWMPGGLQTITPFAGGTGMPMRVLVDAAGAAEVEKQRAALTAKGQRPYFDFEHEDGGASFWPSAFFWKDGPESGIYARGEWSADGKAGVEGKKWRMFSPVFHVDNKHAAVSRIICKTDANPNMGGLVNTAAFKAISPLWAKNATGAQSGHQTNDDMKPTEDTTLDALQAKNQELQTELTRLKEEQSSIKAKNENDALVMAKIREHQAAIEANQAKIELAAIKAKNAEQSATIRAHNEATAKAAVNAAIERGAIAAKDTATIDHWTRDITERPEQAAILAKMGGSGVVSAERITRSAASIQVTGIAAKDAVTAYGAILAKNVAIPMSAATADQKAALAGEAAAIFAADLGKLPKGELHGAILAADSTSDNLGVLTGAIALQATLPALLRENPLLGSVSTDFSAEPGLFGRTDNTRIVLRPAVQSYVATAGADGRPQGWTTASDARTVDVPVTLDQYFAVPIVFGVTTLGATGRRLFDEQAPQAISAMGSHLVNQLTALMTAANFNAFVGTSLSGGATTSGSKNVTITSSTAPFVGAEISGAGIPAGTIIREVTSATALVLSKAATATASSLTFTISGQGQVTSAMASYVKALASFAVADLDTVAAMMDNNNVPLMDRFACLRPDYYRKLGSDSAVNALMQGTGDVSYLSERRLPKMSNFELLNASYMPTGSNRQGFAGHKASLVVKTRLPQDLSQALPGTSMPGNVATITDPATGISMALVSFFNLQAGFAEWRPELMAGVAVGDRRAGILITSA